MRSPGPDFGSIPNGSQVVPPGRLYLESALQSTTGGDPKVRNSFLPVLARFGVVEDLEVRAQMSAVHTQEQAEGEVTGHGPLDLGFKYRLGKGGQGLWEPSVGIQAQFLLPVASAGLDTGKVEPGVFLNLDHYLAQGTTLTWNPGVFAPVDPEGQQYLQTYLAAVITQDVGEHWQVFVNTATRGPMSHRGHGFSLRLGGGLYWYLSRRIVAFGGYNWGLTSDALDTDGVVGVTLAF